MAKKKEKKDETKSTLSILKLKELLSGPDLKAMLLNARTVDLKRYVTEIAGKEPHPTQDDSAIIKHLCKWIDGDKNWMYAPNMPTTTTRRSSINEDNAHTHKEGEMKNTANAKKIETKKGNGKAAKTIKVKVVKSDVKKSKAAKKGEGYIVGKTTGKTRPQFLVDLIVANVKAKKTDSEMLAIAQKEFGAENIPGETGLYNIPRWRSGANYFRSTGKYGLKKSDPKFVSFGK